MGIHAGVGMSHHRNPKVAGQEAAGQALEAAAIEEPDITLMFRDGRPRPAGLSRGSAGGHPWCSPMWVFR